MSKSILLTISIHLLLSFSLCAQTQIKGIVNDHEGKPIESATVVSKDAEGNIISYTRTDANGEYVITINAERVCRALEVSSIGYRKKTITVSDPAKKYNVQLDREEINLKTVVVKNKPVLKVIGDTLIYNPADFADKRDRSIEDVLRRMPGIEIADNGAIKYNGKAISHFYIDGDNLLDGRYNLASQSIPHGAVDKVEVIGNDQPIKMLRKNNMSDDVAINIVIKDSARLRVMGKMSAGAGIPGKYEGEITPMLFKKKLKFINNIKANNTGIDPGIDLTSHTFLDFINQSNSKPDNFLNAGAAGVPTLPEKRTLFNNAALLNLNNFYKFNPDWSLKSNVAYLIDKRTQDYQKFSEVYLPQNTIRYTETQHNIIKPQTLLAKFDVTGNAENYYLKNVLQFNYSKGKTFSNLISNQQSAYQRLNTETTDFSNELNFRKKLPSGNMVLFYSYLTQTTQPEELSIKPGLNEEIFNDGIPFDALIQQVKLPAFYTNNYVSTTFVNDKWMQSYKVGFNVQHQELNTDLLKILNNKDVEIISPDFVNNLKWNKTKWYANAIYEYKSTKFKSTLLLPFSYNEVNYWGELKFPKQNLDRFYINPSLQLKYNTGVENYMEANYSFSNGIGNLNDIYYGGILIDYRTLSANDAPLPENKTHRIGASYNFRKALKMVFFNVSANYSTTERSTISSYTLNDNIAKRVAKALPNKIENWKLSGSMSKYLFSITTTVSGGADYNFSKFSQLQNDLLLPYEMQSLTLNGKILTKISTRINWDYSIVYSTNTNRALTQNITNNFQQMQQQSGFSLLTVRNIYVNLAGQYIYSHQTTQPPIRYIFADAGLKYTYQKIRTDFEFLVSNIGNIKTFEAFFLSANSFTSGKYNIPGRSAMLKATFNF